MQIDPTGTSDWGPFRLIPTEGWKLNAPFIDQESGLLIASESPIDTSPYPPDEHGVRLIPRNTYVIDTGQRKILTPEEWRARFDYGLREYDIEGENLRLAVERKPAPHGQSDFIEENLIDTENGRVLVDRKSAAFHPKPRKNAYKHYRERQERERLRVEQQKRRLSLENFSHRQAAALTTGDLLLSYQDEDGRCFRVTAGDLPEVVLEEGDSAPPRIPDREQIRWRPVRTFPTPEDFWRDLTQDRFWYKKYRPFWLGRNRKMDNGLFAFPILHLANRVRYTVNLDLKDWEATRLWEKLFDLSSLDPKEKIQVCPHCMETVPFTPQFPTRICHRCVALLADARGRPVSFDNVSMGGGLQGRYRDTGEKYDLKYAFIGDRKFAPAEPRMGGVAIVPFREAEEDEWDF